MGNTMAIDPRLKPPYMVDYIPPSEKARLAHLLKDPVKETFLGGPAPGVLPILGLPRFAEEGIVAGDYLFSLRGDDEALFRAYLNKFLDTWGAYVWLERDPVRFPNGEWAAAFGTRPDTASFILGRPVVPPKPVYPDVEEEKDEDIPQQNVRI